MRKLTIELIISAIIVSLVEVYFLIAVGLLSFQSYFSLFMITVVLAVLEIFLVFLVEELIVHTKKQVKKHIKMIRRGMAKRKSSKR